MKIIISFFGNRKQEKSTQIIDFGAFQTAPFYFFTKEKKTARESFFRIVKGGKGRFLLGKRSYRKVKNVR